MTRSAHCLAMVALAAVSACRRAPADDGACRCTPANRSQLRRADGTYLDSTSLLGELRRHRRLVTEHRPPRDIKLIDDELRLQLASFCQPCGDWVGDRMTIEDMFPLDRIDDATAAVCMGLILRDQTTVYGDARPRACR